jgi:sec-independent protein translocase protein TatB
VFDIGFSEMVVCAVVALVVIGPERLPKVARTLGVLFGRLQRYVAQVKSDINREMDMADLGKVKTEFESAARSFETDLKSQAADVEREVRDAQSAFDAQAPSPQMDLGIDEPAPPPLPPKGPGEQ